MGQEQLEKYSPALKDEMNRFCYLTSFELTEEFTQQRGHSCRQTALLIDRLSLMC